MSLDFMRPADRIGKRGVREVYPEFRIGPTKDLLIRGGDFYAVWVEEKKLWSTDENDLIDIIDHELIEYGEKLKKETDDRVNVLRMAISNNGTYATWRTYSQQNMRDNAQKHPLDEQIIYADTITKREDYASRKLSWSLSDAEPESWLEIMSTLYSEENQHKIEWAIGAVVTGASRQLQKFLVFYGAPGTGKGTVLGIIERMFEDYVSVFDAKALGDRNNQFSLETLSDSCLVAIEQDGDLSRIEDNTKINSLVSHEVMSVNEKFKKAYKKSFKCFLFMGTNKPVRITDAQSGIIRRLIDVNPTGNKIEVKRYRQLMKHVTFEYGGIAQRCKRIFEADPDFYDTYIPTSMLTATNDFYNFIQDSWSDFRKSDQVNLQTAWEMYKAYCEDAKVPYPYPRRTFSEELKNYFREYYERGVDSDGNRVRNLYKGFLSEKFDIPERWVEESKAKNWLQIDKSVSVLDILLKDCPAQLTKDDGTPRTSWDNNKCKLKDIDTKKLHYVRPPLEHIVIDFDLKGPDGKKSREANLAAAATFPPTYAEFSKSGAGIHLHYIYTGDVTKLSCIYDVNIEVKVFNGLSSLRRQLSLCNDIPVATISSGLPLKEDPNTVDVKALKNEKHLRALILKALAKENLGGTKCAIDWIDHLLKEAHNGSIYYDLSDLKNDIILFASKSSNHADYCLKKVGAMEFIFSGDPETIENTEKPIAFYDVEVFPNLFLINWKLAGDNPMVRMINPTAQEVSKLVSEHRLIGFNCRRYDNHILYGRIIGESNLELYNRSQRIIQKDQTAFFGNAWNLSWTDIYDFSSVKQSLKKWEIELGHPHKELGMRWDQPVPEDQWELVAEYCDNDVYATEATYNARQSDFTARKILATLAGMTVNDTTNSLTTRIIFGTDKEPYKQFNYRNLSKPVSLDEYVVRFGGPDWTQRLEPVSR